MTLTKKTRDNFTGWAFVAPQVIGYLLFVAIPIVFSLLLCFSEWDPIDLKMIFNDFQNFKDIVEIQKFWDAIRNTFVYIIFVVPLTIIISLGLAILTNRKLPFMKFFKAALFLPMITSTVAIAMVWFFIYNQYGIINSVLMWLGVSYENLPMWLESQVFSPIAIIIFSIWMKMGYYYVIFDAAVKNVPNELYEAAELDGASSLTKITKILIPSIGPQMFFVSVMMFIDIFNMFSEVYILTPNGGEGNSTYTIAMFIYEYAFGVDGNMGIAAVGSWTLFALVGIVTVIQFIFKKKADIE